MIIIGGKSKAELYEELEKERRLCQEFESRFVHAQARMTRACQEAADLRRLLEKFFQGEDD